MFASTSPVFITFVLIVPWDRNPTRWEVRCKTNDFTYFLRHSGVITNFISQGCYYEFLDRKTHWIFFTRGNRNSIYTDNKIVTRSTNQFVNNWKFYKKSYVWDVLKMKYQTYIFNLIWILMTYLLNTFYLI